MVLLQAALELVSTVLGLELLMTAITQSQMQSLRLIAVPLTQIQHQPPLLVLQVVPMLATALQAAPKAAAWSLQPATLSLLCLHVSRQPLSKTLAAAQKLLAAVLDKTRCSQAHSARLHPLLSHLLLLRSTSTLP